MQGHRRCHADWSGVSLFHMQDEYRGVHDHAAQAPWPPGLARGVRLNQGNLSTDVGAHGP